MTTKNIGSQNSFSPGVRYALMAIFVLLAIGILIGAGSIPFFFESKSMWYKFGWDKTFLRTGKVFGMLAATLLMLQLVLSARLQLLSDIFTSKRLNQIHRINGWFVAGFALLHPLFVFAPENITVLTLEMKYWPEVSGAGLLLLILTIFSTATWRAFLNFQFKSWWLFHRIAVVAAVTMMAIHILFVSDTFESGPPRIAVYSALGIYGILWIWVQIKKLRKQP